MEEEIRRSQNYCRDLPKEWVTSDFTQYKDSNLTANNQVLPCTNCPRWHFCGSLLWCDCHRFGRYLKTLKEARKNEDRY